ncbi:MAG: hypothetical protein ACW99Q_18785, partial [Candidatus Kariarchaeaceae archaeon]
DVQILDMDQDNREETIEVDIFIEYFLWEDVHFEVSATVTDVDNPLNWVSEGDNLGFFGPGKGSMTSVVVLTPNIQGDCELRVEIWKGGDDIWYETIKIYDFGKDISTSDSKIDEVSSEDSDTGPSLPIPFANPFTIVISLLLIAFESTRRRKQ